MNIQLKTQGVAAVRPLAGKVSLVTGSTSGIGLGIARALAEAGSAVVLNGLGVAAEFAKTRDQIAADFGVEVSYSTADMTSPEATALETAEDGITCKAICPGYVYTPLVEAQIDSQAKAHGISREKVIHDVLLAQQPNKHFASVEELGALTVFLASDGAASITGTALPVDGGWTAH
jgi:NAD(P)-dependent dehydrogenase (short-subunit alcohol dehydrogenase family)